MRKGVQTILGYVAYALVILAVLLLVVGVGSGKTEELKDKILSLAGDLGYCDTLGTLTVDQLLDAMAGAYTDCQSSANNCKCKKMTMNIGGPGDYMEIDMADAYKRGALRDKYINYYWILPLGLNVYCEAEDFRWWSNEIDVRYPGSYDVKTLNLIWVPPPVAEKEVDTKTGTKICASFFDPPMMLPPFNPPSPIAPSAGYFSVAHGSQVTVKPKSKKEGWLEGIFPTVDLSITVRGGTYLNKIVPPVAPECTGDPNCNTSPKAPWGWCDGGGCRYDYCRKAGAQCKTINSASIGTKIDCTGTTLNPTSGWSTEVVDVSGTDSEKKVKLRVYTPFGSAPVEIHQEEYWFSEGSSIPVMATTGRDAYAKLSVIIGDIDLGAKTVTITQGCY